MIHLGLSMGLFGGPLVVRHELNQTFLSHCIIIKKSLIFLEGIMYVM